MDFVTTCKYIHPVPAACMAQFVEHLSGYKRFNKKHKVGRILCHICSLPFEKYQGR